MKKLFIGSAFCVAIAIAAAQTKTAARIVPIAKKTTVSPKMDCCKGADNCRRTGKTVTLKKAGYSKSAEKK
jgi:hypothetical protein